MSRVEREIINRQKLIVDLKLKLNDTQRPFIKDEREKKIHIYI